MNKASFLSFALVAGIAASLNAGTIQDAINDAQDGAVIEIPAGEFAESITVRDGMTLVGAGANQTIINGGGADAVVRMGKNAAIVGCTIRNGAAGVHNYGRFIGVFECDIRDVTEIGIRIEGGTACIANNVVAAGTNATGVACLSSNPYVGHNVIQSNKVGLLAEQNFVPAVDHNVFQGNETAIVVKDGAKVALTGNIFDQNGSNVSGQELGASDVVRGAAADELIPHRGSDVNSYREMMKKVFDEATALHPRVVYDLGETPGRFHLAISYPWATFDVLASANDTIIEAYDAYDRSTDAELNAQYHVALGHPGVAVINPQIVDKNLDRYVLEKIFIHPASFHAEGNDTLVFDRVTNIPRIEVLLPPGYAAAEMNPGAVAEQAGNRQAVRLTDVGMTRIHIVMKKIGAAAAD